MTTEDLITEYISKGDVDGLRKLAERGVVLTMEHAALAGIYGEKAVAKFVLGLDGADLSDESGEVFLDIVAHGDPEVVEFFTDHGLRPVRLDEAMQIAQEHHLEEMVGFLGTL